MPAITISELPGLTRVWTQRIGFEMGREPFISSIVNRRVKKEAIVMSDDKVKNDDEEEEERASEEKTSGNWKWKEMLFGLLLVLVFFILPSWYSGDWSWGWKYRSI